jgi:hemerythrin
MSKTTKASANGAQPVKKAAAKKAAPKKPVRRAKKELTADEALMRAWEYSYKNRHRRVA